MLTLPHHGHSQEDRLGCILYLQGFWNLEAILHSRKQLTVGEARPIAQVLPLSIPNPTATMLSEWGAGKSPAQSDMALVQPGLALSECGHAYSSWTTIFPIECDGPSL